MSRIKQSIANNATSQRVTSGLRLQGVVALLLMLIAGSAALAKSDGAPVAAAVDDALRQLVTPSPVPQEGQSATQLPDGRWLLLGGPDSERGAAPYARILDAKIKKTTALNTAPSQARNGHSATLTPNGRVLILGGVDAAGNVLTTAEEFDPVSMRFQPLANPGLIARTGHTATVLADGRLMVAGGVGVQGRAVAEVEVYNLNKREVERFNAKLDVERFNHVAALLPSANVLLWGGIDNNQQKLNQGELYDPVNQRFSPVTRAVAGELVKSFTTGSLPSVKNTDPAADEQSFPVDQALVVRFNQRMAVATLSGQTVTLIGPHGAVPINVVPVEQGLLVFITPRQDLLPDSRYTLFIKDAKDQRDQLLPFTAVGFTTAQLGRSVAMAVGSDVAPVSSDVQSAVQPAAVAAAPAQAGATQRRSALELQAMASAEKSGQSEDWRPDRSNFKGDWRSRRGNSPLQTLPPLQAPVGQTALAGQVLTQHGRGLANVTLSIGGQSSRTDETGRFLLLNPGVGAQSLDIDGETARRGQAEYGFYQARIDIKAGQTNVLPFTIWSTKLDASGSLPLQSPTARDMVVTTPSIPGLELRIPAGTVIRDRQGKIVTKINMTAIPTDRPPFPLPSLGVPTYFTIQPGGATLTSVNGQALKGAQLIYPNFSGSAPGSRIDFWNYDARGKGWYVYGQGTTSKDGKQVIPDAGVAIYEFTGAMISAPTNAPPEGPPPGPSRRGQGSGKGNGAGSGAGPGGGPGDGPGDPNQPPQPPPECGDPVDCSTGLFLQLNTDLDVSDVFPLAIERSYRPRDPASRAFGIGSNLSYDMFLIGDTGPWTYQDLILPDGGRIHYVRTSAGTGFGDAVYKHTASNTKYYGSTIRRGEGACYWELSLKMGGQICFPESFMSGNARAAAAISMTDRNGNSLTFNRDGNGNLTRAASPSGRYIDFTYDTKNRITQAVDNIGRSTSYQYDSAGRLIKATDPLGQFEAYTYDTAHNMLTVQDKRGNLMVSNVYDANNRVSKQTYADGKSMLFSYVLGSDGKVIHTDIKNQVGLVIRKTFNVDGQMTALTLAPGLPEQKVSTFERAAGTNLLMSVTDPLGRKTAYTYDINGNLLTRTELAGTANAATTTKTYTADLSQLASVKDVLGHTTTLSYDTRGNLTQVQDPNGKISSAEYNGAGQLIRITDPLGKVTALSYEGYDLATITDPLNRTMRKFTDAIGRTLSMADALGNSVFFNVDALNRVSQVTDPLGQVTAVGFDANDNTTQVTDAKSNLHQFSFSKLNAVDRAVDPLLKEELYVYDARSRLISKTDRKGQKTQFAHDMFDRMTLITYADTSTVNLGYDDGDRVIRIADSLGGVITRGYDAFNRVTLESSSRGSVAYTYLLNGLRRTMTVSGQPTLTYSYDLANRLIQIDQAAGAANGGVAQRLAFEYDDAGRRIQTIYSNGIRRNNKYDDAGQLISITYTKQDGTAIGDLNYEYDAGGQRIKTSGSLARTTLPAELANVSIDAANKLTRSAGKTFSYDLNGNMTSDGARQFVWNARDELVQIKDAQGTITASYGYDALGRRQSKIIGGVASSYIYDGVNIVQELNNVSSGNADAGNVRENYLSGNVDEVFMRWGGEGANLKITSYLTDANGSVIRLTNRSGEKLVDYTYDPYGLTSADAVDGNPFQYTGRENDFNGLYYYRNRYYNPELTRFISSDPIGLHGGVNTYAYVGGNPISYNDPTGLEPPAGAIALRDYFRSVFPPPRAPGLRSDGLPCGAGCGDAKTDAFVPDFFPKACAAHDQCYGDQRGKSACDSNFKRDMKSERPDMPFTSELYYKAVQVFGDGAYNSAGGK